MLGPPLPMDGDLHHEMHERAERRIRAGLLFGALAEQEKIAVSPEDVEKRFAEIAEQSGKHVAKVRAEYQGERREGLLNQILQNKLLEYLMSQATITDGAAEPAPPAEASEPKAEASGTAEKTESKAAKPKASRKKAKPSSDEEDKG